MRTPIRDALRGMSAALTALLFLALAPPLGAQPKPALVHDVDAVGRAPYGSQHFLEPGHAMSCGVLGGGFQGCEFTGFKTVPAGMRLVIAHVSGEARAASGCKVSSASVKSGGISSAVTLVQNAVIPEGAAFSQPMLAYVEAGSAPSMFLVTSCTGTSEAGQLLTITGYLIAVP